VTAPQETALGFGDLTAPVDVLDLELSAACRTVDASGLSRPTLVLARDRGTPTAAFLARRGSRADDLLRMAVDHSLPASHDRLARPATPPSVCVVITTITAGHELGRVIDGVLAQTLPAADVIVVDNRPATSGVRGWLAEHYPTAPPRYVAEPARGLARARNAGLAAAGSEVVAFLDDDLSLDRSWLENIAGGFGPGVDCVTGLLMPVTLETEAQLLMEQFGGFSKGLRPRLYDLGKHRDPGPLYPFSVGVYGSGANAAFTVAALRRLGGFDPSLGTGRITCGGEDLDMFLRVVLSGGALAYQPAAIAWHDHEAERSQFRRRVWGYGLGLGAVLGKHLAGSGAVRRQMLRRAPAAAWHLCSLDSPKNARKGTGYPTSYTWLERVGILLGPSAYLAARVADATRARRGATRVREGAAGGSFPRRTRRDTGAGRERPLWCTAVDVEHRGATLRAPDGTAYRSVRVLLRHRGVPLGYVHLPLTDGCFTVEEALAAADRRVARRVADAVGIPAPPSGPSGTAAVPVSVAVCTRNRSEHLAGCLRELARLTYRHLEVIVVDNAPTDGATRRVFDTVVTGDSRFRYVLEPRPGLSRARNRALDEATGEIIAFTDDDVHVDREWVDGLVAGFARSASVGCVTGLVCAAEISNLAQAYFDSRVTWGRSCRQRIFGWDTDGDDPLFPYSPGRFGTGANFAVRTDLLRSLGGFDVSLGAGTPAGGGEDLDVFLRVVLARHDISYEPRALVWHRHRAEVTDLRRQLFTYGSGLSALATKYLLDRSTRSALIRRVPRALARLAFLTGGVDVRGAERLRVPSLFLIEWAGIGWGPVPYLRARRRAAAHGEGGER
jgi:glycosyltransferase involved in cell wall biosynthesis